MIPFCFVFHIVDSPLALCFASILFLLSQELFPLVIGRLRISTPNDFVRTFDLTFLSRACFGARGDMESASFGHRLRPPSIHLAKTSSRFGLCGYLISPAELHTALPYLGIDGCKTGVGVVDVVCETVESHASMILQGQAHDMFLNAPTGWGYQGAGRSKNYSKAGCCGEECGVDYQDCDCRRLSRKLQQRSMVVTHFLWLSVQTIPRRQASHPKLRLSFSTIYAGIPATEPWT